MSTRKQALFREVATTTARPASARQSLEDARNLARAGFASDVVFALHVEAGAFDAWLKASEASKPAGTKGMARKNAIREAKAASQAFACARKRLIEATALQRDTVAAAANEYSANQLWRRSLASLNS